MNVARCAYGYAQLVAQLYHKAVDIAQIFQTIDMSVRVFLGNEHKLVIALWLYLKIIIERSYLPYLIHRLVIEIRADKLASFAGGGNYKTLAVFHKLRLRYTRAALEIFEV